jgi:hypothetical protein
MARETERLHVFAHMRLTGGWLGGTGAPFLSSWLRVGSQAVPCGETTDDETTDDETTDDGGERMAIARHLLAADGNGPKNTLRSAIVANIWYLGRV